MSKNYRCVVGLVVCWMLSLFGGARAGMALERPENVINKEVGVFTQLGTPVNLALKFNDTSGRPIELGQLVAKKLPVLMVPVYYRCPRLCGLVLDGLTNTLNDMSLKVGQDFLVATVSINPEETPVEALESTNKFFTKLKDAGPEQREGWYGLTGDAGNIEALMSQLGFAYMKDGVDYAHSAAFMILTPEGKISQYFTGIEYSSFDVRLALIEASKGGIGNAIDHFLLYCFRFDQLQGKYTWAVVRVLRIGGIITLLSLGIMYYILVFRRSRRKSAAAA